MRTSFQDFQERETGESFSLQSPYLLKVELEQVEIQAKLGSMVAYQGDVSFEHAGMGGVGRFMKKALTGEGQSLMKMSGKGEVFLADDAQNVHLVYLEGEKLTVNGPSLLAFDAGIDWDIERVKGASGMMGAGLFNTKLEGTGWVALMSYGPPMVLDVASAPTFADAQAVVAWSGGVTTSMKTDFKAKNLIGRGSGESLQIAFSGQGWVLVQPSEGRPTVPQGQSGGGGIGNLLNG